MNGPVTWWRNRLAVRSALNDPEFLAVLDAADRECAADLAELEAADVGPEFADLLMAVEPPPDPATDGVEAPEGER